jgi:hypothetical protein
VLVEASAHKVFESKDQRIAGACRGVWEHSLAVAALARDILALGGGAAEPTWPTWPAAPRHRQAWWWPRCSWRPSAMSSGGFSAHKGGWIESAPGSP